MAKVLNLLPKDRQKELHFEDIFNRILIFCGLSVVTLILSTAALIGVRFILQSEAGQLKVDIDQLKTAVNKQENSELKAQIAKINNQIVDFKNLSDATPAWSKVILAFGKLIPQDVGITGFSADIDKKQVEISGFAKTREAVIELYNNINADKDNFANINYPFENVAKPKDLYFRFTFFIKPELLKQ